MKRILKSILKKLLRPVLSKYYFVLEKLDKLEKLNEIDKCQTSILSMLSICNPITKVPPAHGTLRKIQLAKTNVLFAFDSFCKEKKLRYWLYAGTHLGAVRHGGFIPWDDDIDIGMMREDFDQFIKIVGSMPQNGRIQYHWYNGFIKIKYIEDDFILDAVDIFPFYQYYKKTSTDEGDLLKNLIRECINREKWQKVPLLEKPYSETPSEIEIIRDKIMEGNNPVKNGDIFAVNYDRDIFRYEWVFPLSTMLFEGRELSVPNNSNTLLESQYGDFMMYPPDIYYSHFLGITFSDVLKHNWRDYEKLDVFLSMDSNAIYEIMTGERG